MSMVPMPPLRASVLLGSVVAACLAMAWSRDARA
jgi:hypothetical protein